MVIVRVEYGLVFVTSGRVGEQKIDFWFINPYKCFEDNFSQTQFDVSQNDPKVSIGENNYIHADRVPRFRRINRHIQHMFREILLNSFCDVELQNTGVYSYCKHDRFR